MLGFSGVKERGAYLYRRGAGVLERACEVLLRSGPPAPPLAVGHDSMLLVTNIVWILRVL